MSEQQDEEWSCPIEEAGRRFFGMSKSGSYAAARRGHIPTVRIGGKIRANVPAIKRMFETAEQAS
jgi:hypothetical protein